MKMLQMEKNFYNQLKKEGDSTRSMNKTLEKKMDLELATIKSLLFTHQTEEKKRREEDVQERHKV